MRILISGSNGLIGKALRRSLEGDGAEVLRLVRDQQDTNRGDVAWSPGTGAIDRARLEGLDAIIHLAGEPIASGRWSEKKKRGIRDSRTGPTRHLAHHLSDLKQPPAVFITASATGFYGDRGDEILDESSAPGRGYLSEVYREWEDASRPAFSHRTRVVNIRTGMVLDGKGGALARMKLPFNLGLGGRLGNGNQFISWISLDDIVGVYRHALKTPSLSGAVNGVSPQPVTNREFTATLSHILRRPALLPVPAFALRLALGEMADALLLSSTRVVPQRLAESNYDFRHPSLSSALSAALSSR
jgi:uncharacterized protein